MLWFEPPGAWTEHIITNLYIMGVDYSTSKLTNKGEVNVTRLLQVAIRQVWRHQRGNENPYIEQITQRPKDKVHKDKQRSTKHSYKTKDRVPWTPLKTGSEFRCSGTVSSSCSTSGTRNKIATRSHMFFVYICIAIRDSFIKRGKFGSH